MEIDKKKAYYADMSLIIVAIVCGGEIVAIKFALEEFSALYVNVFKFGFGTIIAAAIFRKSIKEIGIKYFKSGIILGSFKFLAVALMTISLKYTSVAVGSLLSSLSVVFIPIFTSIVYRRRLTLAALSGAVVCMTGIYFLTFSGNMRFGHGEMIAVLSAAVASVYDIIKEHYVKNLNPITVTITQNGIAAIFYLVAAVILDPVPVYSGNIRSILSMLYIIFFATAISQVIVSVSLKYTTASRQAVVLSLISVFAAVFGYFILNEVLTISQLIGFLFILASIIIIETELKFITHGQDSTAKGNRIEDRSWKK